MARTVLKFLCTGDLHLGASPEFGRAPYGSDSRLADQETVWEQVCELAVDNDCDAILFAGDAFHRRRPTPSEMMVFAYPLDQTVPVIAIVGNHEVEAPDRPTALQVFEGYGVHSLAVAAAKPRIITDITGVSIACLPWTPLAHLIATQGYVGDRAELHRDVSDLILRTARDMRERITDGAAILLAHWSVGGSTLPNGMAVDRLGDPVLPLAELEQQGWDAIVLGHIHKPQMLSAGAIEPNEHGSHRAAGTPIFYVGSPAVVDFGEAESPHGVWLLDLGGSGSRATFLPVDDRRFVTVDVDLTTSRHDQLGLGPSEAIAVAVGQHGRRGPDGEGPSLEGSIVRIRYRATPEQARRVDHDGIRQLVRELGVWKLFSFTPEIVRADRARVAGVDETMSELEALKLWIDHNKIGQPLADRIGARAAKYLQEEAL